MVMTIDFINTNRTKAAIDNALDSFLKSKEETIIITNIPSKVIEEMYELEITDFNGWQCDWWSSMQYKGVKLNILGCAWNAEVRFTKAAEEENEPNDLPEEESVYLTPKETADYLKYVGDFNTSLLPNELPSQKMERLHNEWREKHGYQNKKIILDEEVARKVILPI